MCVRVCIYIIIHIYIAPFFEVTQSCKDTGDIYICVCVCVYVLCMCACSSTTTMSLGFPFC